MSKKLTLEEVLDQFRAEHGDRYDYSKVIYRGSKDLVAIICPKHGMFSQAPEFHKTGSGCPSCGKEKVRFKLSLTSEEVWERFQAKHGSKYDYSLTDLNEESILIICPKHGKFRQRIDLHLRGNGCSECGRHSIGEKNSYSQEDFLAKAKAMHGNTYDYSLAKYSGYSSLVTVICSKHGSFEQTAGVHLAGHGCWRCSRNNRNSRGELAIQEKLNSLSLNFERQKSFDDLRNPVTGYRLYFDFYLPDLNFCIEYDGAQHSVPVNFIGQVDESHAEALRYTQYKDSLKTAYCVKKDICLIRISYLEDLNSALSSLEQAISTAQGIVK